MVEQLVMSSILTGEFMADKDLVNDAKVREAYQGFVSAFVSFTNALAAARSSHPPLG